MEFLDYCREDSTHQTTGVVTPEGKVHFMDNSVSHEDFIHLLLRQSPKHLGERKKSIERYIADGWITFRGDDISGWTVRLPSLTNGDNIQKAIKQLSSRPHSPVVIHTLSGEVSRTTAGRILAGKSITPAAPTNIDKTHPLYTFQNPLYGINIRT